MKRWPKKRLGEIGDLINGRAFKSDEWESEGGRPIIRIQNLNDPLKPFNYTTKIFPEKFSVKKGDILLSWSGTPGTSFGCFRWDGPQGWLNQHIFNVKLAPGVVPDFFIHQVNFKLSDLIAMAHGGVGLQHITKEKLSSLELALPPVEEQERIVTLLNEAGELRKLQAANHQRLEDLFNSLLHRAFQEENV